MDEERSLAMSEDEFLEFLSFDRLKKEYSDKIKSKISELQADQESRKVFLEKSRRDGIETDRLHRDLINSCIYPFTERGPLAQTGYRFIRGSPLAEFNIPNLDFLLYKRTDKINMAIFGECKGSISSHLAIINELNNRKAEVQRNMDSIKENYLKVSKDVPLHVEYVIAVPTNEAVEMLNRIIEGGGGQIVWQVAIAGNAEISIAFPHKGISEIRRESMIHKDPQLNRALDPSNHTKSNRNAFNIFPKCHQFIKLSSLLHAVKSGDPGLIIDEKELKEVISQDLFYEEDNVIDSEIENLLSKGVDIEFLERTAGPDYVYKIKARGTKTAGLAKQMEDKWIKYQLQCDLGKSKDASIRDIRRDFVIKRGKYKSLFDF